MNGLLKNPVTIGILALVLVILAAATFAIVPETQQAVVYRLAQPIRVVNKYQASQPIGSSGAGLIARVPFLDRITWVDKRVLDLDLENTQVLSTDQLRLNVDAFARFRVVDPRLMLATAGSEEGVANQLRPQFGSTLRNELGKVRFATLLTPERGEVMDSIQRGLDRRARQYGVEIVDVRIKQAELPEGTPLDSALRRMQTARQQEAITIAAEGQRQARIVQADADAEASRIYAESFGKDAGFYDFYRAMQSYRRTFGADGSTDEKGATSIILSPSNSYLREFVAPGR
ncbi:protease modulator HflC [Sphingomonas sp. Leaf343]|uniref:protease modulator HflC n=1 Tax=Sphingomonas sp. Leaf343 TaxID=1736345 RepID=UPI0006F8D18F|nr:protease modulator HflC [Sphingomonas sp. Leaf343]KQR83074.1 protease modulator HflC [Sphingomonas sp. Leaf343]